MLEKLTLLKIASCRAPALSSKSCFSLEARILRIIERTSCNTLKWSSAMLATSAAAIHISHLAPPSSASAVQAVTPTTASTAIRTAPLTIRRIILCSIVCIPTLDNFRDRCDRAQARRPDA